MSHPVTLRDVAAACGVSVATVSAVRHRADWVSNATRARVQATIDALGYRPSRPAQVLVHRRRRAGTGTEAGARSEGDSRPAARLRDVAAVAGVSTATVSAVAGGAAWVSRGTAERVWSVIESLNYRPNLHARALRRLAHGARACA